MTEAAAVTRSRFQGPFWLAVAFVFALQVAVVFFANKPSPDAGPLKPQAGSSITLSSARPPELTSLEDPTLFVLPNLHGFSGQIWMPMPPLMYEPRSWSDTEPVRWLLPATSEFFETFSQYLQDNADAGYQPPLPEAPLTFPPAPAVSDAPARSSLRIEGELAGRTLLNPEPLPPVTEAYTNSVVQVVVDPLGYVYSAVPAVRTGSTNDDLAVRIAFSKRFAPIEISGPNRQALPPAPMMNGTLIFEWRPPIPDAAQPAP